MFGSNILKFSGVFLLVGLVRAGEYCRNQNTGYSEYCSGYCCSSESDSCCSDWGWIAGVIVGVIIFIAIVCTIIFLVCQKMNAKKSQTVHVQMSNYQNSYPLSNRHTRGQRHVARDNQNTFTTHMSGNALPPPPPYSQTYNPNPAYPPPPPYPGSPLPVQNNFNQSGYMQMTSNNFGQSGQTHMTSNNFGQSGQTQMTSHAQFPSNNAYPPPPVT